MKLDEVKVVAEMKNLFCGGVPHEVDFLFFKQLNKLNKEILFVDVGANAGQSAISFLLCCSKGRVISFEPNAMYQRVLDGISIFLGGENRFQYHMIGLSDANMDLDLHVPTVDGVPYLQEASLDLSQFQKPWVCERLKSYGKILEIVPIKASFKIADSMLKSADVVKIDAEGAELQVLRGMVDLIQDKEPIFLIENNDYPAVTEFLKNFGYRAYFYDQQSDSLLVMSGATTNCYYLKPDHFVKFSIKALNL